MLSEICITQIEKPVIVEAAKVDEEEKKEEDDKKEEKKDEKVSPAPKSEPVAEVKAPAPVEANVEPIKAVIDEPVPEKKADEGVSAVEEPKVAAVVEKKKDVPVVEKKEAVVEKKEAVSAVEEPKVVADKAAEPEIKEAVALKKAPPAPTAKQQQAPVPPVIPAAVVKPTAKSADKGVALRDIPVKPDVTAASPKAAPVDTSSATASEVQKATEAVSKTFASFSALLEKSAVKKGQVSTRYVS